jgi:hypothetical protein
MPLLARRTGTGSHYGPCMHRGTGLNGAAGPVSRALVMIVRLNRGSSTDLGARSWNPGRGGPKAGRIAWFSGRIAGCQRGLRCQPCH